jgi:hypothetical protein
LIAAKNGERADALCAPKVGMSRSFAPIVGQPNLYAILVGIRMNLFSGWDPTNIPSSSAGLGSTKHFKKIRQADIAEVTLKCE